MKQMDLILEAEPGENGAAALAMVLRWYGKRVAVRTLVAEGCENASEILEAARRNGLFAEGRRMTWEELKAAPLPCLVHLDFCAFAVVTAVKNHAIEWYDPEDGYHKTSRWPFLEHFTGVVLCFAPAGESSAFNALNLKKQPPSLRFFFYGLGIVCGLFASFSAITVQVITERLMLFRQEVLWLPWIFLLVCLLLAGVSLLLGSILLKRRGEVLSEKASRQVDEVMDGIGFSTIKRLQRGELAAAIKAVLLLPRLKAHQSFCRIAGLAAGTVLLTLLIQAPASALSLLISQLLFFLLFPTKQLYSEERLCSRNGVRLRQGLQKAYHHRETNEMAGAAQEVFAEQLGALRRENPCAAKKNAQLLWTGCGIGGLGFCIFGVSFSLMSGGMQTAQFAFCLWAAALEFFLFFVAARIKFDQATERNAVQDARLLSEIPEISEKECAMPTSITIQSMSVQRQGNMLLSDLTLLIQQGEIFTFLDEGEGGVDTLGAVLSGMEEPSQGKVYFDRQDASSLSTRQRLRVVRRIGSGLPFPDGTVMMNLRFGQEFRKDAEFAAALRDVGLWKTISHADLQLPVAALSAGEKILLEVACCMVSDVPFLVLPEDVLVKLDEKTIKDLIEKAGVRKMGLLLLASHEDMARLGDTVCRFRDGRMVWQEDVRTMEGGV